MESISLEAISHNPWSDEEHVQLDKKVLDNWSSSSCDLADSERNERMRTRNLVVVLLQTISDCKDKLDSQKIPSIDAILELVEENSNIQDLLMECWRVGQFRKVRLLSEIFYHFSVKNVHMCLEIFHPNPPRAVDVPLSHKGLSILTTSLFMSFMP